MKTEKELPLPSRVVISLKRRRWIVLQLGPLRQLSRALSSSGNSSFGCGQTPD
ncbi:MAG: hypothetical protein LC747_04140 [Acidobacteria bacterium]|nr:hypothetical protein [Acidobacteriota bacterium]